jgi:hypothetical protein
MRQQAKTAFEKDFFKLMNNSVYGKFIENVRNHSAVKIFTNTSKELTPSQIAKFKSARHLVDGIVAYDFAKTKCKLNKPIIIGQAILDLSKLHMSQSWYGLKDRYPSARLLMTDTDSFIMELPKKFNQDLLGYAELADLFDFSNYPEEHPLFSTKNKAVVGKFKYETAGKGAIIEFAGLRAKMYAYRTANGKEAHRAKGIGKTAAADYHFENYKKTLLEHTTDHVQFSNIRSRDHMIYTVNVRKTGLSPYDNKFYAIDNVNTVPYGYAGEQRS